MNMDSKNNTTERASSKKPAEKESFFQSLLASLFKSSNPEAEKKRRLKNLAKTISKTKYHSFYRTASGEMLAPFGKLMFELYKAVASAQTLFRNTQNPAIFKRQIINYVLSENQIALLDQLDEQKILELARTVPIAKLQQDVEHKLQVFTNDFNETRATKADNLEKAFSIFQDFCEFDYYMILKKFDSSYQEFSFNAMPRLDKVNAEYIVDDLKDFLAVAYSITDDTVDWAALFDMFKETQSREIMSIGNWKKIIAKIKNIQASKSLDLIVQHISEDFAYETKISHRHESIIEPYIEKIENDTRNLMAKIEAEQKESKASSICMQIFGTANPQSLKYYTADFNAPLEKKGLSILEYTEPLNYASFRDSLQECGTISRRASGFSSRGAGGRMLRRCIPIRTRLRICRPPSRISLGTIFQRGNARKTTGAPLRRRTETTSGTSPKTATGIPPSSSKPKTGNASFTPASPVGSRSRYSAPSLSRKSTVSRSTSGSTSTGTPALSA